MLEINLGNKTLVFGIVIALILSYGMVNFNSMQRAEMAFPKASAAVRVPPPIPPYTAVAEVAEVAEGTKTTEATEETGSEDDAQAPHAASSGDAQAVQGWSEESVRRTAPRDR
ncbi:MAG: hypothetical protein KF886_20340 [Candidatus Hydrogenedentes bacterium]|nr:hypothetical protein [Candidatus Hydrogenedentota bacterium]